MWTQTDHPIDEEVLRVIHLQSQNKMDQLSDPAVTLTDLLQTALEEIETLNLESMQECVDRLLDAGLIERFSTPPYRYCVSERGTEYL